MIFVERAGPAPASLTSAATLAETDAARAYYASWEPGRPAFDFKRYALDDVKEALKRIFHQKCAYCEGTTEKGAFNVEHYRPKGAIEGCPDHPGYWWLAHSWTNLLPSCPACNQGFLNHVVTADMTEAEVEAMRARPATERHGKLMQFPVTGPRLGSDADDPDVEDAHLIDPTRTDPGPHLKWRIDATFSVVEPAEVNGAPSGNGRATIDCAALNRVELAQNRTEILNRLRAQRAQIMDDLERDMASAGDPVMQNIYLEMALRRIADMRLSADARMPYSGMVTAFVDNFARDFEQWAREQGPPA